MASNDGGVGKTMVAVNALMIWERCGVKPAVVEMDSARSLSGILGEDRVDLSLDQGQSMDELARNPRAAEEFFDPTFDVFASGPTVVDPGANVLKPFLEWIERSEGAGIWQEEGIRPHFLAVADDDQEALKEAWKTIERVREVFGDWAKVYLVLNDRAGTGFRSISDLKFWKRVKEMREAGELTLIGTENPENDGEVPFVRRCDSLLWEAVRTQGYTPFDAYKERESIAKKAGMNAMKATRAKKALRDWVAHIQDAFAPIAPKRG
ncbi:hypothetical protein [Rhodovibrio sodomensis]|nr:hypothetical protein [Rhodovibrio sodomensis]